MQRSVLHTRSSMFAGARHHSGAISTPEVGGGGQPGELAAPWMARKFGLGVVSPSCMEQTGCSLVISHPALLPRPCNQQIRETLASAEAEVSG